MTADVAALEVEHVDYRYGDHVALSDLSLRVEAGEIFAILGPNGSGKTTLFRLISTLTRLQSGDVKVFGKSLRTESQAVRAMLGVVFQSPSLDAKLTVLENIECHGMLYGLSGKMLRERIGAMAEQLGITDRLGTKVEKLSGGLKRRVELVKGLLHRPKLVLLDEPSTGLDPAARLDLWHAVDELRQKYAITVLLTTHLLEEAEKADRITILHRGRTVAVDTPRNLRSALGEQILTIQVAEPDRILAWLAARSVTVEHFNGQIRVVSDGCREIMVALSAEFGQSMQSLTLGQPSLEDVFIARTGHRFWDSPSEANSQPSSHGRKKK